MLNLKLFGGGLEGAVFFQEGYLGCFCFIIFSSSSESRIYNKSKKYLYYYKTFYNLWLMK